MHVSLNICVYIYDFPDSSVVKEYTYIFAYICMSLYIFAFIYIYGFPDSSVGKESVCNAGDPGSNAGWGRSAGEGIRLLTPVF